MHNRLTIQRPLMRLPRLTEQLDGQLSRFVELECMLVEIQSERLLSQLQCVDESERVCWANLSPSWHRLWHPLSEQAMARSHRSRFQAGRSIAEQQVAEQIAPLLRSSIGTANPTDFLKVVESIVSCFDDSQCGFRKSPVFLGTDAMRVRVEFPGMIHIAPQLQRLHEYIHTHLLKYPLFVALVSMVTVLNCHPFLDCNGRSARLLFNVILQISKNLPTFYIPLYELFWRCGCGWEIRMRYAEISGDWNPLCQFIWDLLRLVHSLANPQGLMIRQV